MRRKDRSTIHGRREIPSGAPFAGWMPISIDLPPGVRARVGDAWAAVPTVRG